MAGVSRCSIACPRLRPPTGTSGADYGEVEPLHRSRLDAARTAAGVAKIHATATAGKRSNACVSRDL